MARKRWMLKFVVCVWLLLSVAKDKQLSTLAQLREVSSEKRSRETIDNLDLDSRQNIQHRAKISTCPLTRGSDGFFTCTRLCLP